MSAEARIQQIEQYAAECFGRGGELYNGFMTGAIWADNNPDLSLMWHDADDEPEDGSDVLLMDSERRVVNVKYHVGYYDAYGLLGWPAYVANYDVKRWAYISALLPHDFKPKGGDE